MTLVIASPGPAVLRDGRSRATRATSGARYLFAGWVAGPLPAAAGLAGLPGAGFWGLAGALASNNLVDSVSTTGWLSESLIMLTAKRTSPGAAAWASTVQVTVCCGASVVSG